MHLGGLLNLIDPLPGQAEVFADVLKAHPFGAHPYYLGNLVDQLDVGLSCFHIRRARHRSRAGPWRRSPAGA